MRPCDHAVRRHLARRRPDPRRDGLVVLADGDLAMVAGPTAATTTREDALAYRPDRRAGRLGRGRAALPLRHHRRGRRRGACPAARARRRRGPPGCRRWRGVPSSRSGPLPPEADGDRAESGAEHLGRLVSRSRLLNAAEGELGDLLTGRCRVVRRLAGHEELKLSCLVERPSVEPVRSVLRGVGLHPGGPGGLGDRTVGAVQLRGGRRGRGGGPVTGDSRLGGPSRVVEPGSRPTPSRWSGGWSSSS